MLCLCSHLIESNALLTCHITLPFISLFLCSTSQVRHLEIGDKYGIINRYTLQVNSMDKTCHNDSKPRGIMPHTGDRQKSCIQNMPISCSKDSGGITCKAPRFMFL